MIRSNTFKPRKLVTAIVLASAGVSAFAQTDSQNIESITVYGQRAAQNKALEQYRQANAITNFISSDDMGQFVDQNVAESLQRLPGISITRDQGEGRFVSVRGVDAGLSTVSINGMRIGTPEDGSRAVPLDVIPTGSVEVLEITKVPTPDMPGDAIGGSVNVRSGSAFDREGRQLTYRVETSYNDLSGDSSPKGQFNFSDVFDGFGGSDNIGVSFGINYLDRKYESDNIEPVYDYLDFNGQDVLSLLEVNERKYFVNRERLGFNLNLEFQSSENSRFFANTVYSEFTDAETRQRNVFTFEDARITAWDGQNISYADLPEGNFRRRVRFRTKEQDTLAFAAGAEHDMGSWSIDYNVGVSTTRERVPDEIEGRFRKTGADLGAQVRIGTGIPQYTFLQNGAPAQGYLDNSIYAFDRVVVAPLSVDDDDINFAINMEVPQAFGVANLTLKTGLDGRFKDKDSDVNEAELRRGPNIRLDQFTGSAPSYGLGVIGQGISSSAFVSYFNANRTLFSARPQDVDSNLELNEGADFTAEEDVKAGYLMGTWELDRLQVIAGARVERTEFSATGNDLVYDTNGDLSIGKRKADNSYTNLLPGLHLRYEPLDNLVLRAAWSNTIARPNFNDISPRRQLDEDARELNLGNPELDPYESSNLDLLADWYLGESGVISAGVFYKDIDNYIVDFTTRDDARFPGLRVSQPINGTTASIVGVELNAQTGLEVLSSQLQGFLAGFNLTVLDTELKLNQRPGEEFAIPEAAEQSGNLYLGYETERLSARLSLSQRDKYLSEVGDTPVFDLYVAPHTQLDMTASYRFNERFELVAELTNLTDEALELYQGSKAYTYQFEEYGPTFAVGIKGRW